VEEPTINAIEISQVKHAEVLIIMNRFVGHSQVVTTSIKITATITHKVCNVCLLVVAW
jgi:hypothetical protein